jgi:hypothetical protein
MFTVTAAGKNGSASLQTCFMLAKDGPRGGAIRMDAKGGETSVYGLIICLLTAMNASTESEQPQETPEQLSSTPQQ